MSSIGPLDQTALAKPGLRSGRVTGGRRLGRIALWMAGPVLLAGSGITVDAWSQVAAFDANIQRVYRTPLQPTPFGER